VVNVVDAKSWDSQVEKLKMLSILLLCDAIEIFDDHPKIISGVFSLLEQILNAHVEYLNSFKRLVFDSKLIGNILEFNFANNIWHVFSQVGIVFKRCRFDHPNIS